MRQPIKEFRLGLIKVCIWLNQTKAGERHNVTAVRLYRNGDLWKESSIFGRDDLPLVCKALDQAHTWIFEHIQQERCGGGAEPD